jgi:hypothetical protein
LRPSSATTAPGRAGAPDDHRATAAARAEANPETARSRAASAAYRACGTQVWLGRPLLPSSRQEQLRAGAGQASAATDPPPTKGEPSGSAAAGLRTSGLDLLLSKAAARDWDLCRRSRSTGRRRRCRRRSGTCVCRSCVPARCPGAAASRRGGSAARASRRWVASCVLGMERGDQVRDLLRVGRQREMAGVE